jgi:ATP-binding cassette subfamily F protein uup
MVFEGDGRLEEYVGGYDDWLRQRRTEEPAEKPKTLKSGKPHPKQERPRKLTFKENKELEALPARLEALEAERDKLFELLASPELYQDKGGRVAEIKARLAELEKGIAESYERWELLEEIVNAETV